MPNSLCMGCCILIPKMNICFCSLIFQHGHYQWQDGSPLVDYTDWYTKSFKEHEPTPCSDTSVASAHWLGITARSSNPRVDVFMNFTHPVSNNDNYCVGFVATEKKRSWLSIPCDQKFTNTCYLSPSTSENSTKYPA